MSCADVHCRTYPPGSKEPLSPFHVNSDLCTRFELQVSLFQEIVRQRTPLPPLSPPPPRSTQTATMINI